MLNITWVEIILGAAFGFTFLFSVAFCLNNYSSGKKLELAKKAPE